MQDKWIKIGFWAFAGTALFFGVVNINQKIKIVDAGEASRANGSASDAFGEVRMRVLDTDEDGLNDWEELNVYKTSPYLTDSDSDGATDSDEVAQGTDPICPKGRVCGSDIIKTLEDLQQDIVDAAGEAEEPAVEDFSPESQKALEALESGSIPTAEQIRSLLRDSGIPEDQLAGTSDEDLIQLFQEVAAEQTAAE